MNAPCLGERLSRARLTLWVASGLAFTRPAAGATDYFTTGIQGDNPLAFHAFTFTPNGSAEFYGACQAVAAEYPTDPTGGTVLALDDDSTVLITLSGTNTAGSHGQR